MKVTFVVPSWRVMVFMSLPIIGVGVGLAVVAWLMATERHVPDEVRQAAPFAVYVPTHLPKGFRINKNSYQYSSREGTVVFEATDEVGDHVVFTEQRKPAADIDQINQQQLAGSVALGDVPYPSTLGKTPDRSTSLISIVAGNTWIMVSTQAELDRETLRLFALGLKRS